MAIYGLAVAIHFPQTIGKLEHQKCKQCSFSVFRNYAFKPTPFSVHPLRLPR